MGITWLIIDGNSLAWRSHYAIRGLSHKGKPTAVLFGFLRDLVGFKARFRADNCVVCFDQGRSLREKEYPNYKANRRNPKGQTADLRERVKEHQAVREQMEELEFILPQLGFNNVLSQQGYEADDLIASVCYDNLLPEDEAVIAGSDKDLLQLLSGQVSIWNYRKHVTLQSFWAEWGLEPKQWVDVKALAGCPSDGIKGIKGIGELSAVRYLRGEMKPSRALDKIDCGEGPIIWDRNRRLVELPWPGLKPFFLYDDVPDQEAWDMICREHGMETLLGLLSPRQRLVK